MHRALRLLTAISTRPDLLELLDGSQRDDPAEMREEAAALRIRMAGAAELFDEGVLTASQLSQATTKTWMRLEEVQATLTVSGQMTSLSRFSGSDVDKVWAGFDIDERRSVIDTLLALTLR